MYKMVGWGLWHTWCVLPPSVIISLVVRLIMIEMVRASWNLSICVLFILRLHPIEALVKFSLGTWQKQERCLMLLESASLQGIPLDLTWKFCIVHLCSLDLELLRCLVSLHLYNFQHSRSNFQSSAKGQEMHEKMGAECGRDAYHIDVLIWDFCYLSQTFLKNGLSRFHYGYFWPILFLPFQHFNLHQHYQTSFGVKLRYGSENFQRQVAKYLFSILGGKVAFSMNESHLEELEEVLTTPGNLWVSGLPIHPPELTLLQYQYPMCLNVASVPPRCLDSCYSYLRDWHTSFPMLDVYVT